MYKSIYELPVRIYHRIIETDSLEFLFTKKPKGKHAKRIFQWRAIAARKSWERINGQLINEFGVSEEFRMIFYIQQDINNLEIKALLGDPSATFFINVKKQDIERIKKDMITVTDYKKHHARLRRAVEARWRRDSNELSTFDFYNDLADLQKEALEKEINV